MDAARKLKAAGSTCPFVTNAEPWIVFEQFAARHGQPIATKHNGYDGLDAEYDFNKGLIAKHLTNLVDWRKEGLVRLNGDTKGGNLVASFSSGECAMIEASSGSYTTFTKAFEGKYELSVSLTPMYKGETRHNTLVGGASIYIMKGHSKEEIDGAKAFLNFVRTPEQQMSFSAATVTCPSRTTCSMRSAKAGCEVDEICDRCHRYRLDERSGDAGTPVASVSDPTSSSVRSGLRRHRRPLRASKPCRLPSTTRKNAATNCCGASSRPTRASHFPDQPIWHGAATPHAIPLFGVYDVS